MATLTEAREAKEKLAQKLKPSIKARIGITTLNGTFSLHVTVGKKEHLQLVPAKIDNVQIKTNFNPGAIGARLQR